MEIKLTDAEKQIAARIGFDAEILQEVKQETGEGSLSSISRLLDDEEAGLNGAFDGSEDAEEDADDDGERWYALTATVPREASEEILLRLREPLIEKGYLPFLIEQTSDFEKKPDRIAVLKGTDPLGPLQFCNTNAANYDIGPEEVQVRIADWQRRFHCDVLGAEFDSALIHLHTLPPDMDAFARELYEFCPDLLDQGILVMVDEAYDSLPPERQEEIDKYMEADTGDEEGKTERVALKILADTVRETRRIHLWWD